VLPGESGSALHFPGARTLKRGAKISLLFVDKQQKKFN